MLVLASSSPRRRELLQEWGYDFKLVSTSVSEELEEGIPPAEGVQLLAKRKALSGLELWRETEGSDCDLILGADTIVVIDDMILGKPVDKDDAKKMLRTLSGRVHKVMTGIALVSISVTQSLSIDTGVEISTVSFRDLSILEIEEYIATGEPMDKAAAYAIQGGAEEFVIAVSGSLTNVIGLPKELLTAKLEQKGFFPIR